MRHSVAAVVALQAALCFAPSLALLHAAMRTDGRGIPETPIPLSAKAYPYYAAQFRFFTPNPANLYIRIAHRGAWSAAERKIKPSDFHLEIDSTEPEFSYEGAWFPGSSLDFPNTAWDAAGKGPPVRAALYAGRNYLVSVRRDKGGNAGKREKFEMILRVEEPDQPQRMSGFGVFLLFCSALSSGIGAALFRRNLRRGRIIS